MSVEAPSPGLIITTAGAGLRLLHAISPAGGPANRGGCRVLLRVAVADAAVPWLARAGPGAEVGWAALAGAGVRADAGPECVEADPQPMLH